MLVLRGVGVLTVGVLTFGVLTVPATAQSTPSVQTDQQLAAQSAQQSAQSVQSVQSVRKGRRGAGALAEAKRAEKQARVKMRTAGQVLSSARDESVGAREAYAVMVAAERVAKDTAAAGALAVERARFVVGREQAFWDDWNVRMAPVEAAETSAHVTYDAAAGVVSVVHGEVQGLQRDVEAAYVKSAGVLARVNSLMYEQVPAQRGVSNRAVTAVGTAVVATEQAQAAFYALERQYYGCRMQGGGYECQYRSGDVWEPVAGLDELDAAIVQRQADHGRAVQDQAAAASYLALLEKQLADGLIEFVNQANWIDWFVDAKASRDAVLVRVTATMDAARVVFEERRGAADVLRGEADGVVAETAVARSSLPGLEATQLGLDRAAGEAGAQVVALGVAADRAGEEMVATEVAYVRARVVWERAVKRVKKIRRSR